MCIVKERINTCQVKEIQTLTHSVLECIRGNPRERHSIVTSPIPIEITYVNKIQESKNENNDNIAITHNLELME